MKSITRRLFTLETVLAASLLAAPMAAGAGQAPAPASAADIPVSHHDRVYAAEQYSNTVSVTDPADNKLLGVIRLGEPQPKNFSPLYRGQVLVHGLGFSPDHRTLYVADSAVTEGPHHPSHIRAFRVADDGTLWLNLGDSYTAYNGNRGASPSISGNNEHKYVDLPTGSGLTCGVLKPKDLIGVPWKVAFALQADGWYLRSDIIWAKPNPMPESVRDRPTKSHEYLFLLTKRPRYYWDAEAVKEPSTGVGGGGFSRSYAENQPAHGAMRLERPADNGSRNIRSVWTIATAPFKGAHFATFPPALVEPCVKAGTSEKGCCSALVKRLRIRPDLTDEQRAMVYARLGAKALV